MKKVRHDIITEKNPFSISEEDSSQNPNNTNNNFIEKEERFASRTNTQIFQIEHNQNEEPNKNYDKSNVSINLQCNNSYGKINNLTYGEYIDGFIHFDTEEEEQEQEEEEEEKKKKSSAKHSGARGERRSRNSAPYFTG
jgi:hypothetical protein